MLSSLSNYEKDKKLSLSSYNNSSIIFYDTFYKVL